MPFFFWVKDAAERYTWANRALTEFAATDFAGKTDRELPPGGRVAARPIPRAISPLHLRTREIMASKTE
jgi:hypothetical protein